MKDNQENVNTETSMATTSILEREYKEVAITPPKEVLVIDNNVYTVKIDQTAPGQGTLIVKQGNSNGEEYDKVNGPWTKQNIYIAINNNEGSDAHSGYKEATYTIKKDGASYLTNETTAKTISFTIRMVDYSGSHDETCFGEEGMTWAEWCASSYNAG